MIRVADPTMANQLSIIPDRSESDTQRSKNQLEIPKPFLQCISMHEPNSNPHLLDECPPRQPQPELKLSRAWNTQLIFSTTTNSHFIHRMKWLSFGLFKQSTP